MTDKEIIKALGCCTHSKWGDKCAECFYCECDSEKGCQRELIEDTLDLINRQQAEIEELHKRVAHLDADREGWSRTATTQRLKNIELQAEIERLEKELSTATNHITRLENQIERLLPMLKTKRAEAIKEFIEKLKDLSYESDLYDRNERWVKAVTVEEIDETYKEMGLE